MNMHRCQLVTGLLSAAVLHGAPLMAAEEADDGSAVDTSRWECRFCPEDEGRELVLEPRLLNLSDDARAFGDYRGLDDSGLYPDLDLYRRWRDGEGKYLDILGENLGLDVRRVRIDGGHQGRYAMQLRYQAIPHYTDFGARTPFSGGRSLDLPSSWVTAGSTGGMTALEDSLRGVDVGTDRDRLGLRFEMPLKQRWDFEISFHQDRKSGRRGQSASILTTITELAMPVDEVTERWDVAAGWRGEAWYGSLSYHGSSYEDRYRGIAWDNPFTPVVGGADQGRIATAPDNSFHQVKAAFTRSLATWNSRLLVSVASGRGRQDEAFLPLTINNALAAPTLPRADLDGEVDTKSVDLRLTARPLAPVSLVLDYDYDDRDNDTPVGLFPIVVTDSVVGTAQENVPYSFRRESVHLGADVRVHDRVQVAFDLRRRDHHRELQEVLDTEEDQYGLTLRADLGAIADLRLELEDISRVGSDYSLVPGVTDLQNPRMRRFNMADRDRERQKLRLSLTPLPTLSLGATASWSEDDYPTGELGLREADSRERTVDAAWMPEGAWTLDAYATRQSMESRQLGSRSFAGADWSASNDDRTTAWGLGARFHPDGPWSFEARWSRVDSIGATTVITGTPGGVFPDLRSEVERLNLSLDYRPEGVLSYGAGLIWERVDTVDWALDGIQPETIPTLLALGTEGPDYDVVLLHLSLTYRFD